MASSIIQLSEVISNSVADLVGVCATNGLRVPDINERFSIESEAFRANASVARAANVIAAAAIQLAAYVLPPQEFVMQIASGHMRSAALRVSIECNVPEILRDAGPEGLHADEIAIRSGVDGMKLARVLRLLAGRHIFREVRPDVFVNNRISGLLDTGKDVEELFHDPGSKHDETSGFIAFSEIVVTDGHKASAYLMETMKDPVTAHSGEPHHAPLQRSLGITESFWDWYARPEQIYHRRRFGVAMKGATVMDSPNLVVNLFDWKSLPQNAVVVDVGGGIGSSARTVLKANPQIQFIVQDIPTVVADGIKYWEREDPGSIESGRIEFRVHDFFTPQPIMNASVFLLKNILHDWSNVYSTKILTNLRNSANPDTKLLILDIVMTSTCREPKTSTERYTVFEDQGLIPPDILSTGFCAVTDMVWTLDAAMLVLHNTQEHTLTQYDQLLTECGWRIVKVIRSGSSLDSVQAVPA